MVDGQISCKTCGCSLDEDSQRLVGAWTFCASCLEKMLNVESSPQPEPPSQPPQVSVSEPAESLSVSVPSVTPASTYECCICEQQFDEPAYKKISSASVCESCFSGLIPAIKAEPPPPRKPFVVPKPKGPNTMSQKDIAMRGEMAAAPAAPRLNCVSCAKQLPAIGAAKVEAGQLYCPDCYVKLELATPAASSSSLSGVSSSASSPTTDVSERRTSEVNKDVVLEPVSTVLSCDCCERTVTPEIITQVQGLMICHACENYDREAAVRIARARHAALFEAKRNNLVS